MKYLLFLIFNFILISTAQSTVLNILILGDSLSEGQGVNEEQAFPRLVERNLKARKHDVLIINGGVSGSTTANGMSRLKWHMKKPIDILVLELGANDGLRGLKLSETEKNLKEIIAYAKEKKIKVLLLGLLMPPNYGLKYTNEFKNMYRNVSKSSNIPLHPFLLNKVAGVKELNLPDGIHPNEKGHEIIAQEVTQFIEKNL